jgi:hypothetical protein
VARARLLIFKRCRAQVTTGFSAKAKKNAAKNKVIIWLIWPKNLKTRTEATIHRIVRKIVLLVSSTVNLRGCSMALIMHTTFMFSNQGARVHFFQFLTNSIYIVLQYLILLPIMKFLP